jgi:hypothetical protein
MVLQNHFLHMRHIDRFHFLCRLLERFNFIEVQVAINFSAHRVQLARIFLIFRWRWQFAKHRRDRSQLC